MSDVVPLLADVLDVVGKVANGLFVWAASHDGFDDLVKPPGKAASPLEHVIDERLCEAGSLHELAANREVGGNLKGCSRADYGY
jgi:hypothetical protein